MVLSCISIGRVILVLIQLCFDCWFFLFVVLFGFGFKNSELWVGVGSLYVKMGWVFVVDILLMLIMKVEVINVRVYVVGVYFGFGCWLVNGLCKGLVVLMIDLFEQVKMWKKLMMVCELWVSVIDLDVFVIVCMVKQLVFYEVGGLYVFVIRCVGDG